MNYKQSIGNNPRMQANYNQLGEQGQQAIRQQYRAGGQTKGMAANRLQNQAQKRPAPAMAGGQYPPPMPVSQSPTPQVTQQVPVEQQSQPSPAPQQYDLAVDPPNSTRSEGMPWMQQQQQMGRKVAAMVAAIAAEVVLWVISSR